MSAVKEKNALISEAARNKIEHWLTKYPQEQRRSAVLPALSIVQDEHDGWLSTELMDAVAEYLGMPPIAVYEVATFYSMYDLEPVGRHKIAVCNNISCMLCGGDGIIAHIENKLGIKIGETSADGKFTLKREEECLAACAGAPMMAVDGHYYENLTPEKVDAILDGLE
ncbi:MAG: NADH-quinone oxidoreductase subunit NuoE [Gammaproteobacteria bacterium]